MFKLKIKTVKNKKEYTKVDAKEILKTVMIKKEEKTVWGHLDNVKENKVSFGNALVILK